LARAASPALRRAAIAGWALHRQDPGEALSLALRDPEPGVRARALRAMGELGRRDLLDLGGEAAGSRDDSCQYWSAWASALLVGDEGAVSHLRTFAEASGSHRLRAAALAARRMDPGLAAPWREQLAAHPDGIGAALAAAAACGDPSAVPWLIECMSRFDVARPAGEAFTQITGVDLEDLQMVGSKPEEFESGPTEDPDDENVEMDPDADLPWPDMGKIRAWWDRSSSIFIAGTRYLVGRPIRTAALKEALRTARQRQRGAAAIELAMRDPGSRLFEVRAPGFRQRRALGT
jgi:uncharacterized protein (TIGR02270 family)